MKTAQILTVMLLAALSGKAQVTEVVDFSGKGIAGAHVISAGAGETRYGVTDEAGRYTPDRNFPAELIKVSAVGYEAASLRPADGRDTVRIVLERSVTGLDEVVITAQYAPKRRADAVQKMRVIGAEEITARGAVNVTDVLRQELNFRISNDNILGAGLTMMGISGENVKILINGVPVIGRLDGNIDLNQLNVNEIEQIEITEGPLAVNYGTNALAGTINIITKRPEQNSIGASAEAFTESSGHYNLGAAANAGRKNSSLRLSAGRNFFDGWHPGDSPLWHRRSGLADITRFQQWNPREQVFGRAAYRISGDNEARKGKERYLEIGTEIFREEIINRGRPDAPYGERAFDDTYRTARSDVNLKYQSPLGERARVHIIAAFNDFQRIKNTYVTDLTGVSSTLTDVASLNDTSRFQTAMSRGSVIRDFGSALQVQAGYEVEIEYADGERIDDPTGRMENYAAFATAEWQPAERITLKPGLRATVNSRYDAPLVPSLNTLWKLNERQRIRASYARGFRAPGLKELSFYFVDINHNIIGNPDLDAEDSHHYSIGFEQHTARNSPWGYGISAFYNDITNLITLAAVNETEYSYVNIGEQQTGGLQGQVNYAAGGFDVQVGALYTAISNRLGARADVPGFIYTPEANANLRYTSPSGKWTASVFYKYNGARNFFLLAGDEVRESVLAAFHTADLSAERRFWDGRLSLQAGSKNLFNLENIMAGAGGGVHGGGGMMAVGTGRTYFLRLAVNFEKQTR